jgi:hypothetical protein
VLLTKKIISAIVFSIVTLIFFNCLKYIAKDNDKWNKFKLQPSQLSYLRDIFLQVN